eukprot:CAMPEP_0197446984 /NCGR_PEP_ID=MMETSP1175-20131217/11757_1 /TAXON_ID=1003142 /ORGANISM="Triceratium dubium, Strain CCMP147" /LENGTH=690 /DNA_ID=CAMNT_0042978163 /DNA_START=140 /DNA_END=2212 /DNA_ORIENTATION=-
MSETDPLVGGSSSGDAPSPSRNRRRGGIAILSLSVLVVLVAGITVLYNVRLKSLSTRLTTAESDLAALQEKSDEQAEVIARFADSVTNADVLARVNALDNALEQTKLTLSDRLEATEDRIGNLLNDTLLKLNTIVSEAQDEIHHDVELVKTDVDSYVRTTQDQFSMENSFMIYQLAGTFTLLACLITMWHMTSHLRNFNEPSVQRKILAILWMSPLYGITSWLSLVFPPLEGYLAVVKDFYEAYVIYQFLAFLIEVLGRGDRSAVIDLLARHADHLEPPFRLLGKCFPRKYDTDREMASEVLLQCQGFAMQFVFCRPLTTIGIFVCNKLQYYGGGQSGTDYRSPQFWFIMIQNVSIFFAFSGLLKFYHAVQDDLAWCRPFPKFLCIKGIVFMTFWQGLAIAILAKTTNQGEAAPGMAQSDDGEEDPDIWAKQAQNFLICLEMLLFSIAHFYCFPTEEWEPGYRPKQENDKKFGDNIALRDFVSDLKMIMTGNEGGKKKKKKKRGSSKEGDEEEGGGNGSDGETEATHASGSALEDEPVTPQMRKAADRLLRSLNFENSDSAVFEPDEDMQEGFAGLMEKIARASDDSDDEYDTSDQTGGGGLNGAAAASGYGTLAESGEDNNGPTRRVSFDPKAEKNKALMQLGHPDEELGSPEKNEQEESSSSKEEDENKEGTRTENDHLLRPSIFTTM